MKKLDKEELKGFAALDDNALWGSIRALASEHGFTLKETPASHEELERVRAILLGAEKINMREAIKLINTYKKK